MSMILFTTANLEELDIRRSRSRRARKLVPHSLYLKFLTPSFPRSWLCWTSFLGSGSKKWGTANLVLNFDESPYTWQPHFNSWCPKEWYTVKIFADRRRYSHVLFFVILKRASITIIVSRAGIYFCGLSDARFMASVLPPSLPHFDTNSTLGAGSSALLPSLTNINVLRRCHWNRGPRVSCAIRGDDHPSLRVLRSLSRWFSGAQIPGTYPPYT